jgi:hypothetical protein
MRARRIGIVVAALLLAIGGFFVVAGPAAADDSSEFPYCEQANPAGVGTAYGGGFHSPNTGDWYAYGPIITTKTWSACEDINITWQYWDEWRWRVRFYPSSGGSYVNSWKTSGCDNLCAVIVATNVSNGTSFRMEGHKLQLGGVQETYSRGMDMRW